MVCVSVRYTREMAGDGQGAGQGERHNEQCPAGAGDGVEKKGKGYWGPMAPFYHSGSVLATHKSLYLKTKT